MPKKITKAVKAAHAIWDMVEVLVETHKDKKTNSVQYRIDDMLADVKFNEEGNPEAIRFSYQKEFIPPNPSK